METEYDADGNPEHYWSRDPEEPPADWLSESGRAAGDDGAGLDQNLDHVERDAPF